MTPSLTHKRCWPPSVSPRHTLCKPHLDLGDDLTWPPSHSDHLPPRTTDDFPPELAPRPQQDPGRRGIRGIGVVPSHTKRAPRSASFPIYPISDLGQSISQPPPLPLSTQSSFLHQARKCIAHSHKMSHLVVHSVDSPDIDMCMLLTCKVRVVYTNECHRLTFRAWILSWYEHCSGCVGQGGFS